MNRIKLEELSKHYGKKVTVSGFVDSVRNLQWVQFIVLRDETGKVQITIEKSEEKNAELVKIVDELSAESTIKVMKGNYLSIIKIFLLLI